MIETASANRVHKASNYITMFDTVLLPYNKIYNNCSLFCSAQAPHIERFMVNKPVFCFCYL